MRRKGYKAFITIIILALAGAIMTACDTTDTSDYYGPRVRFTVPVDREVGVSPNSSITVAFTEEILASTVNRNTFLLREVGTSVANISGSVSTGFSSAVFTPDSPLAPGTTYVATLVPLIADVNNNLMSSYYSWHFTTGAALNVFETHAPAGVVAGQTALTGSTADLGASALNSPSGAPFVYNGMLYVPDTLNNRVLGFINVPTAHGETADFALGQPDLLTGAAGNSPSALNSPSAVHIENGRTYVADTLNNRVLIWESVAATDAAAADTAVGQIDLYANDAGCGAGMLNAPEDAMVADGRLIVADTRNNRVLVWNNASAMISGAPADVAVGQGVLDACAPNRGGSAMANTLSGPAGLWSDGARLAVADTQNNRVLIWRNFPAISNIPADVVLGQPSMEDSAAYVSAVDMDGPTGISVSPDGKLFVVDSGNSRVMVWNRFPGASYESADEVLGQQVFYGKACNEGASASASTLCGPRGAHAYGIGNLVVTDAGNNRALIYNAP